MQDLTGVHSNAHVQIVAANVSREISIIVMPLEVVYLNGLRRGRHRAPTSVAKLL